MRAEGLEPSSSLEHRLLRPGCLPFPPPPPPQCRCNKVVLPVVNNVNVRSKREFDPALALLRHGLTATEVARATGIPRSTVRDWGNGRGTQQPRSSGCEAHDSSSLDASAYAYLLGLYLGDGYVSPRPRGVWLLRITLDSAYPGIVEECARAVDAIAPGKTYVMRRGDNRAVTHSRIDLKTSSNSSAQLASWWASTSRVRVRPRLPCTAKTR